MVCIGKNIANCSKNPQFLPVMCTLCPRCLRTVRVVHTRHPCTKCNHLAMDWPFFGWGYGLAPFQLGIWTGPFLVGDMVYGDLVNGPPPPIRKENHPPPIIFRQIT